MKTILLSLTAAAALAAAVTPAAAQPYGGYRDQPHYDARVAYGDRYATDNITRLNRRVSDAILEHRISWEQGREMKADLGKLWPIAARVRSGQASGWERERLDRTEARIENALNRYAQNDRYDWRRR